VGIITRVKRRGKQKKLRGKKQWKNLKKMNKKIARRRGYVILVLLRARDKNARKMIIK
jgi:ribonuclease D